MFEPWSPADQVTRDPAALDGRGGGEEGESGFGQTRQSIGDLIVHWGACSGNPMDPSFWTGADYYRWKYQAPQVLRYPQSWQIKLNKPSADWSISSIGCFQEAAEQQNTHTDTHTCTHTHLFNLMFQNKIFVRQCQIFFSDMLKATNICFSVTVFAWKFTETFNVGNGNVAISVASDNKAENVLQILITEMINVVSYCNTKTDEEFQL